MDGALRVWATDANDGRSVRMRILADSTVFGPGYAQEPAARLVQLVES